MDKRKLIAIVVITLLVWLFILRLSWTPDWTGASRVPSEDITQPDRSRDEEKGARQTNGTRGRSFVDGDDVANWTLARGSPRLLCLVLSIDTAEHLSRARAVRQTWGRRCDKLVLVRNGTSLAEQPADADPGDASGEHRQVSVLTVPLEHEGRDQLWHKVVAALKFVHANYLAQFDWFMKADDDTYVLVDNMKQFLASQPTGPHEPIYFGHKFKPYVHQGYMSGGAGYVLSRRALELLVVEGFGKSRRECHLDTGSIEDVELGSCVESVGVAAGDSRDSEARPRFLPLSPESLLTQPDLADEKSSWYASYAFYGHRKVGKQCCSRAPISFHYITWPQMYLIDWLLYDVQLASKTKRQPSLRTITGKTTTSGDIIDAATAYDLSADEKT